tara:strand:- start:69512 stop:69697 length:186 start_codon:yes stop_codon:yes gene_type:complete
MFGMPGTSEIIIIFLVLLVLFGGKKLPQLARGMGEAIGEFKKGRQKLAKELNAIEKDLKDV